MLAGVISSSASYAAQRATVDLPDSTYIYDSMRESEMRKEEKRSLGISKLDAAFLSRSPFAEIFVVIKTVLH